MTVRPTMKFIYLGYAVAVVIVVVLVVALERTPMPAGIPSSLQHWIPFLPVLLLLWPLKRHLRNRVTKLTILEYELRYETGLLSKTTRSMHVQQVQDVTVHQRVMQRIFRLGDVSIETAGKESRITIPNVDRPQEIAEYINQHSHRQLPADPRA
jgi:uncharacterized membrane protein YdbT with pleckstrin-like domain